MGRVPSEKQERIKLLDTLPVELTGVLNVAFLGVMRYDCDRVS
ncbi:MULTISPECIES: hypothetical protein [unclassified Microcoleus]|nr:MULTISPECIES: hypothetical protein [unclassified Microcoleus]